MNALTLYDLGERISSVWPKFRFKKRRDKWKNSYERRVYESVDDKSLYILGYISKIDGKNNSGNKGLNITFRLNKWLLMKFVNNTHFI